MRENFLPGQGIINREAYVVMRKAEVQRETESLLGFDDLTPIEHKYFLGSTPTTRIERPMDEAMLEASRGNEVARMYLLSPLNRDQKSVAEMRSTRANPIARKIGGIGLLADSLSELADVVPYFDPSPLDDNGLVLGRWTVGLMLNDGTPIRNPRIAQAYLSLHADYDRTRNPASPEAWFRLEKGEQGTKTLVLDLSPKP